MTDAYLTDSPTSGGVSTGTADTVRDEAANLKDGVVDAGKVVGGTVKDEAAGVVEEAKAQASSLFVQLRDELNEQAATQQNRAAVGLRSVSDDLRSMAGASSGGVAADLVSQASGRAGTVASFLDGHDPASLLEEVRNFARRRPGTFIAFAAVAGLLAGRITRSAASNASDSSSQKPSSKSTFSGSASSSSSSAVDDVPTLSTDASAGSPVDTSTPTGTTATPLYSSLAGDDGDLAVGGDGTGADIGTSFDETDGRLSSPDEFGTGNAQRLREDER